MPTLPVKTSGHVVLANRPGGVKCVIMLFNRRESGRPCQQRLFAQMS